MRIYNKYIISLAIVLLLSTVVLTAAGGAVKYFFPVFVLESIVITELFVYLNNKARRQLTFVSAMLFLAFLAHMVIQVGTILARVV